MNNDELSKHYGGRRVTGVLPGLQNQCGAWYVPGGFDSHMSPPKERKKNMGMNQTPVSERVHIGFFGKRNAGKSSVMNAVTGQDLAVVSDVKGTTTDPVYKTMELLPLGPVVMMDTPGIDDEGELGELRVKKSYQVLNKTDIAVVVIDGTCGVSEEDLKITERIQKKNIPYIIVLNKCERFTQEDERLRVKENTASYLKTEKEKILLVSAADKSGIYELKDHLGREQQLKDNIAKVKADGAELIVVIFHWGNETETVPDTNQMTLGRLAIDEGADLVCGHHPHVLQGIDTYKGKNIVYSLGNFCFGGNSSPSDMDTMIFQQTFTVTSEGVQADNVTNIIPCSISSADGYNNYQPTPASGDEASRIKSKIEECSAAIPAADSSSATSEGSDSEE